MTGKQYSDHNLDLSLLPLFRNIPPEVLQRIKPEEMVRFYRDGEVIFHQGDEANCLVVILHGQIRILADGIFLVSREAPEVIGEQAIINQTTRSATAVAQGMVKALVIPRPLVEHLMTNAIFAGNLLHFVSQKLSEATGERAFRFRNEQLLFSEFSAHLSPRITQRLLATGLAYGYPRYIDAIILISDIRAFTERSAGMTPQEIASQLSAYFDATVNVIHRHEGLVDKFIGDAVMAIWGFIPGEGDSLQAFSCAKEMVETARRMFFGGKPIVIGIGLNAGQVFIGNVGGEGKRQFTVLGMPVNLTARYQNETKVLDAPIVMGKTFYDRLPPDLQKYLVIHENRLIKGTDPQTLYTYTSVNETG